MKISVSVELMMQLAAQEAIAAEFKEIQPEHLLESILKLAELPTEDLDKFAVGSEVAKQLTAEVLLLRQELQNRSIDSLVTRRKLRDVLGKGGSPYDGGQLHRSQPSREVFDAAGKLASDSGSETISVLHLLLAALASPTKAMIQAVGQGGVSPVGGQATPVLAKLGQDLMLLAASGKLSPEPGRIAEGKALVRALAEPACAAVFLIGDDDRAAKSVVNSAVHLLMGKDAPGRLKGRRIIDVTGLASPAGTAEATRQLEDMLGEARTLQGLILFLPALGTDGGADLDRWIGLLKKAAAGGTLQVLCRAVEAAYRNRIEKDSTWRNLSRAMWLQEQSPQEMPSEL